MGCPLMIGSVIDHHRVMACGDPGGRGDHLARPDLARATIAQVRQIGQRSDHGHGPDRQGIEWQGGDPCHGAVLEQHQRAPGRLGSQCSVRCGVEDVASLRGRVQHRLKPQEGGEGPDDAGIHLVPGQRAVSEGSGHRAGTAHPVRHLDIEASGD